MKRTAKKIVAAILGYQVRRLYKRYDFKVIAVAGSVGKTSTKLAIANVLKSEFRVQYQDGNYNDIVSVPLIFFGRNMPSLFNPLAWLVLILKNELSLIKKYPFDIVVVELGSDGIGQIAQFKKYLKVDIGVLTAIAPEHMEYFGDMDAVAKEELTITELSSLTLVNKDMIYRKYLPTGNILTYGLKGAADYSFKDMNIKGDQTYFSFVADTKEIFSGGHEAINEPLLYSVLAACAVCLKLGVEGDKIKKAIASVKPFAGRMRILNGINNSKILDDTYNASPTAVESALRTLYDYRSPQKIALLGSMNELGQYSADAHTQIGELCEPKKLDLVVTLGPDANKYLASAAEARGCRVVKFDTPYEAGEYIKQQIKPGAVILAKGSQNNVFAEEAVKLLLADPKDSDKLVRQSRQWLKIKAKNFK